MRSASERGEMILLCSVTGARSEILKGKGMPDEGGGDQRTKANIIAQLVGRWGDGIYDHRSTVSLT